jgi:hypothetical protein
MTRNPGFAPRTADALSSHRSQSEAPNPTLGDTGSQTPPAERLTARQMGLGPVEDRPRGIGTTWELDVPTRISCTCPRCATPLEGWVGC